MQNLQTVFDRMQETKREQKAIRAQYKDAMAASAELKEVTEKLQGYRLRKKKLEADIKAELGSEYERLETLKRDLQMDQEMMADIALSTMMKGETVELKDPDGNLYEPIFSVKFKKTNQISQAAPQ